MSYMDEYKRWVENVKDEELSDALKNMDEAQIEDAFYRDLEFGTGGLRGTIGAGTNRMYHLQQDIFILQQVLWLQHLITHLSIMVTRYMAQTDAR